MRKMSVAVLAIMTLGLASFAHALTPNSLPHYNRSDVDDTVKVFIPLRPEALSVTVTDASNGSMVTYGSGNAAISEVNSLGFAGMRFTAVANDVHMIVPLPPNACVSCPIKFSVAWSTSDVTPSTDTATWKVLYAAIADGESLSAASTALDTAITADAIDGDAYAWQETPQGVIAADTLSRDDVLHVLVELDAVSGLDPSTDVVFMHGLFMEYTREKL